VRWGTGPSKVERALRAPSLQAGSLHLERLSPFSKGDAAVFAAGGLRKFVADPL